MIKLRKIKRKKKKAVSVIVGYVLLITFGILMSLIVYAYLKSYVPRDALKCPDGVSVFIKEYTCSPTQLDLTIKNNGRFNFAGYFIHATDAPSQDLATIDLSPSLLTEEHTNQMIFGNSVLLSLENANEIKPNMEISSSFNLEQQPYLIEIIPVRFQGEGKERKFVSCGNSLTIEKVTCE